MARSGIIGGGSIGVGWAIVFARSGHDVAVYESDQNRVKDIINEVLVRLEDLDAFGLLNEPVAMIANRVVTSTTSFQPWLTSTMCRCAHRSLFR